MERLELRDGNKVTIETSLTKGQIAKFNAMQDRLVIRNGSAYISTNELHGVLLTRSREDGKAIVNNYRNLLRIYLVNPADIGKMAVDEPDYVRPAGLQILLEQLAMKRPQRANDYRASAAFLACIVAGNAQLAFSSSLQVNTVISNEKMVMARVKKLHTHCQLSGQRFDKSIEKHAHHIVAKATNPALAAEESNLVVITGKIHSAYHKWVTEISAEVNRVTLKNFCRINGYSLDWNIQDVGRKGKSA